MYPLPNGRVIFFFTFQEYDLSNYSFWNEFTEKFPDYYTRIDFLLCLRLLSIYLEFTFESKYYR